VAKEAKGFLLRATSLAIKLRRSHLLLLFVETEIIIKKSLYEKDFQRMFPLNWKA
jgi:hypothetical protein